MKPDLNALKLQFGALFQEVSASLFAADPVCIDLGGNIDEYDSETGTILPRLVTLTVPMMCRSSSTRSFVDGLTRKTRATSIDTRRSPRSSGRHEKSLDQIER